MSTIETSLPLQGKSIILTGGNNIGKAILETTVAQGARVAVGQRTLKPLKLLAEKYPGKVFPFQIDISKADNCYRFIEEAAAALEGIDILVNNAAITGPPALSLFLDNTPDFVDKVIDTNLKGLIHCSIGAAKLMGKKKKGVIIHISSVLAYAAMEGGSVYSATKSAITALTKTMALELFKNGIRVVTVAPGDIRVDTQLAQEKLTEAIDVDKRFVKTTPLGQGETNDVSEVVAFLCSDKAKFVTGTTWITDGGYLTH